MSEITIIPPGGAISTFVRDRISTDDAVRLWLAGFRSENTRRAYRKEIERFVRRLAEQEATLDGFLSAEDFQAHTVLDSYKARMRVDGSRAATINRSMSAISSFVRSARRHGLTSLRLEVKAEPVAKYRDTRGPGLAAVKRMVDVAGRQRKGKGWFAARDVALVRLLFGTGLRRAELASLDLDDLDRSGSRLAVIGKGRSEPDLLTVPPATLAALCGWIAVRGEEPGPLFLSPKGQRLTGDGVYRIVGRIGVMAGIEVRPHGIRHTAITAVLDATNGDQRRAQQFARHRSAQTTVAYDDNRQDAQGSAARLIDALME